MGRMSRITGREWNNLPVPAVPHAHHHQGKWMAATGVSIQGDQGYQAYRITPKIFNAENPGVSESKAVRVLRLNYYKLCSVRVCDQIVHHPMVQCKLEV